MCPSAPDRSSFASTASSVPVTSPGPMRPDAAHWRGRSSLPASSSITRCLRNHRVRPLGLLNDSKQVTPADREELFRAVVGCAERIAVRVISSDAIDRNGLHRMNLAGLRSALHALSPPAEICLVDGFRLGPTAPEHRAVVDGDEQSAAIAAASIMAKVVRDRAMRRMDAALSALWLRLARRVHHPGPFGQGAASTARPTSIAGPSRRCATSPKTKPERASRKPPSRRAGSRAPRSPLLPRRADTGSSRRTCASEEARST